ncbi:hypothetical protein ILYODFUR_026738, partial [Ilyodon furcidens]
MFSLFATMLALFGVIFLCVGSLSISENTVSQDVHSPTENYLLWMWQRRPYIYSAAALLLAFCFFLQVARKKINYTEDLKAHKAAKSNNSSEKDADVHVSVVKIFYGSQTGTAKGFATELSEEVENLGISPQVIDMKDYDPDDQLVDECVTKSVCVFLMATYTDGQPTENAEWFCKWVEEASTDFRYGNKFLKGLRYAVFGLGNSVYVGHYNTVRTGIYNKIQFNKTDPRMTCLFCWFLSLQVGKNVDKWLWMLGGKRIMSRGEGDCNVVKSRNGSVQADFLAWKVKFLNRLKALSKGEKKSCSGNCKSGGSCKNKKKHGADEEKAAVQDNGSE